ncbi:hypothetical protein K2X33_04735 [bacterium]|nr:hypothetical protein [bacterium]
MKRLLFSLAVLICCGGTAEGLPSLPRGQWYSRTVDTENKVVSHYATYALYFSNGESRLQMREVFREALPSGYQPGDLEKALPAPNDQISYESVLDPDFGGKLRDTYQVVSSFDYYGVRTKRKRFILREPVSAPTAPKEEVLPPPVDTPLVSEDKPAAPAPSEKVSQPRRLVPPSELGQGPLVGESLARASEPKLPALVAKPKGPSPLVEKRPEASDSVDWLENSTEGFSQENQKTAGALLKAITVESSRWQFDLSQRFLTCNEGMCLIRESGKGVVEVPFQVGMGRVWLLNLEAGHLAHALENGTLTRTEAATHLLHLLRRLEAMEGHLEFSHEGSKSNYSSKLTQILQDLRGVTADWNASDLERGRDWVLRWQLLLLDTQVIEERSVRVEQQVGAASGQTLKALRESLRTITESVGEKPWEESAEFQYELAKKIYFEALPELRRSYKAFAREADRLRPTPGVYIDMLAVLGAAENLGVYSWKIMEELSQSEEK